jgi:hypothetical protein
VDEAPADETRGKGVEGGEDVGAAFVADGEAAETTEQGERPFDDLARIMHDRPEVPASAW